MTCFELLLLATALSVDAFVVAFSYGLVIKKHRAKNAVKLSFAVGGGQFLMPVVGWYATLPVSRYIEKFDHWLVFLVFAALGLNVIKEALSHEKQKIEKNLTLPVLLALGTATSIDALVTGVSLYLTGVPIFGAATVIGLTTFCFGFIGFYLNRFFKKIPEPKLEITAGVILIALGVKVLFEHLFGL
jgi:putative Mn2+ efflux pump MntP